MRMNEAKTYYSNGKLLLTAEYFVLKGAKAIALPLKFGQSLTVSEGKQKDELSWKAYHENELWFSARIKLPELHILQATDKKKAAQLVTVFHEINRLNGSVFFNRPLDFETHLNFNPGWGFGTSSTLIANLARWADVDPFRLNESIFSGSGFDIACASADGPIFYQREISAEPIRFEFPFKHQLHFVYLGHKKTTKPDVEKFLEHGKVGQSEIGQLGMLSENFLKASALEEFQALIFEHENIVSRVLEVEPIKKQRFSDFPGEVKSLGAWGGDFVLAASDLSAKDVRNYFKTKKLETVFSWDELILERK